MMPKMTMGRTDPFMFMYSIACDEKMHKRATAILQAKIDAYVLLQHKQIRLVFFSREIVWNVHNSWRVTFDTQIP